MNERKQAALPERENCLRLAGLINDLDEDMLHEAAQFKRRRRSSWRRAAALALAAAMLFGIASLALAMNDLRRENREFYLRSLTPDSISLSEQAEREWPDFGRMYEALKSDDMITQYIAINRLIEAYNYPDLRSEVCAKLRPFLNDPEPKLAEAAALALDILEDKFTSDKLVHMADGAVICPAFYEYSDYGSHNQLLIFKDGELHIFDGFYGAQDYIGGLLPSPDGKLLAVELNSYKSSFIMIFDEEHGYLSPELIDTARLLWAGEQGRPAAIRCDYENYSGYNNLRWLDNNTLAFDGWLTYLGGEFVDNVAVTYSYNPWEEGAEQGIKIEPLPEAD